MQQGVLNTTLTLKPLPYTGDEEEEEKTSGLGGCQTLWRKTCVLGFPHRSQKSPCGMEAAGEAEAREKLTQGNGAGSPSPGLSSVPLVGTLGAHLSVGS